MTKEKKSLISYKRFERKLMSDFSYMDENSHKEIGLYVGFVEYFTVDTTMVVHQFSYESWGTADLNYQGVKAFLLSLAPQCTEITILYKADIWGVPLTPQFLETWKCLN